MEGTQNTSPLDAAAQRLRPVIIAATALLFLVLVFFAWSLARSQAQQREDLEERFTDRADVAAAVTDAIFTLAEQQQMALNATRFGGPKVDEAQLRELAEQSNQVYGQILSEDGEVLGATEGAPGKAAIDAAHVKKALASNRTQYSGLMDGPGGAAILESATPFRTPSGTRVQLSGIRGELISGFLNGFLTKLPNVDEARSYVVDQRAQLVAAPGTKATAGQDVPDRALAAALPKGTHGGYGDDRYFTSASIPSTPWRIVLSASKDDLYESVSGSKALVPWLIFGAFVLAAALGLFLLRRVLMASTELARAELSRRHALEINDNVVQRLVVAKYALDRGATDMSQQKLAETLRETQQLVTSLLEQKDIGPGSLRRGTAAGTEGPPDPPEGRRL